MAFRVYFKLNTQNKLQFKVLTPDFQNIAFSWLLGCYRYHGHRAQCLDSNKV